MMNEFPETTFDNIKQQLLIEDQKCRDLLFVLCCKIPILVRAKKSRKPNFTNDEVIKVNDKFKCKARKINFMI